MPDLPLPTTPTELDPLPYVDDEVPELRLPIGNIGFSHWSPRPEFVQSLSAYENGEQR